MDAVVLDLFGTLVSAPTPRERTHAASQLAAVLGCTAARVESYLGSTWQVRHDGALPTLSGLAAHLVRAVGGSEAALVPLEHELRSLGQARLHPDPTVTHALHALRTTGLRLGVLSDASAEIAAAWPHSPLADLVDAAIFSCHNGALKPDQRLYNRIQTVLGVPAHRMLYIGDGGGDELHGAHQAGMTAVAVCRRGPDEALSFNTTDWAGPTLDAVEDLPTYLQGKQ